MFLLITLHLWSILKTVGLFNRVMLRLRFRGICELLSWAGLDVLGPEKKPGFSVYEELLTILQLGLFYVKCRFGADFELMESQTGLSLWKNLIKGSMISTISPFFAPVNNSRKEVTKLRTKTDQIPLLVRSSETLWQVGYFLALTFHQWQAIFGK